MVWVHRHHPYVSAASNSLDLPQQLFTYSLPKIYLGDLAFQGSYYSCVHFILLCLKFDDLCRRPFRVSTVCFESTFEADLRALLQVWLLIRLVILTRSHAEAYFDTSMTL